MALEILTVPCLQDNYAFLAHDATTGTTALIDIPQAAPIQKVLSERGWSISEIFITHHHDDHVQGLNEIKAAFPQARVTGAAADEHRLPVLDHAVHEGDTVQIGAQSGHVIDVSGHTLSLIHI